jgi:hypothetical protein
LLDYQYNLVQVMNLGFSKATQQQQKILHLTTQREFFRRAIPQRGF